MHDIRFIRENREVFDAALARRGLNPVAAKLIEADEVRRATATRLQESQSRRNEASKLIGQAMGKGDKHTADALKAEVAELKETLPALEETARAADRQLHNLLAVIPNLPAADVPDGADESGNAEVSVWGEKRTFDFEPQEHADIAPALGMDFETGTKLSGARFTFLRGNMARLHRALGQFMLDRQTREYGYTECAPPVLVKDEAMYGTDKLPKFAEDSFEILNEFKKLDIWIDSKEKTVEEVLQIYEGITDLIETIKYVNSEFKENLSIFRETVSLKRHDWISEVRVRKNRAEELKKRKQDASLWLIPTAEVSLTASVMGEILDDAQLPLRLTALTPCFRSEAGAAGKDTRGFIRQHQFEKCELVSIVRPEDSEAEHERMTEAAEAVLRALDLPYRKVLLCTGDMGFGARKTYDLEVWLPGQGAYREISSCSNTGDFQARRMNARYRPEGGKGTEFVHTLNGSGLAVGRTLVAVIENYQQADGSVVVPEALAPYMGGVTKLEPAA